MNRKFQIILLLGFLLLITGMLLNITRDPLILSSGAVAAIFMFLLFRIDPLSLENDRERRISFYVRKKINYSKFDLFFISFA